MEKFLNKFRGQIFYLSIFLMSMTYAFIAKNFDNDLWARLIAGMGVVKTGHVLKTDFVSYTPTLPWIDHEWGSGVVFYILNHYFGSTSFIVLTGLLIFLIIFMISKIVKLHSSQPYNFLFYFFALATIINQINHPVRCHLFSFFFI